MSFVIISRNKIDPPSDEDITKVMTDFDCTVLSFDHEPVNRKKATKVTFTGEIKSHTEFQTELQRAVVPPATTSSWAWDWADGSELFSLAMAGTLGVQYKIAIHNDSTNDGQAIVFQKDPGMPAAVHTLAWLTKTCHPNTRVSFFWSLDFSFVWGQTGQLKPGVNYEAGGIVGADLTTRNEITLSYVDDGFQFGPPGKGPAAGSLLVHEVGVPGNNDPKQGCVGIGMSNAGTFVVPTQNTGADGGVQFTVHPQYWIGMGTYKPGEVVDVSSLFWPQKLEFPPAKFVADCTLTDAGWTITYSQ